DNLSVEGRSAVTRYDPASMEVRWRFRGSEAEPFYSKTCGVAQSLPNGNVLVTESDGGRALELTPEQRVVWEYWNPQRAGEGDRYIATLFEVLRLERDAARWLSGD
ncbi:MAG: arylsulfotransferase family protein, partial [Planctomycetota bacterium]